MIILKWTCISAYENFLINSYLTKNHDKLILTKSNRVKYAAFAS